MEQVGLQGPWRRGQPSPEETVCKGRGRPSTARPGWREKRDCLTAALPRWQLGISLLQGKNSPPPPAPQFLKGHRLEKALWSDNQLLTASLLYGRHRISTFQAPSLAVLATPGRGDSC